MSKTIVEYAGRRITYETPLPFAEVIARLDKEINKAGGGPEVIRILRTSTTKAEIEEGINALKGKCDFIYFGDNMYHRWLDTYNGSTNTPKTHVYVFGNPLIAQKMLRHDLAAALHVPPRILVSEGKDGSGAKVVYDDPAAVIPVPGSPGGSVNAELKKAAEELSRKVEKLVQTITRA